MAFHQAGGFDAQAGGFGASQFAGGGFMPSPAVDKGMGGAHAGGKSKQDQTLRAVTVKQLVRDTAHSDDDTYRVDDVEISTITLVGRVVSQTEGSAKLLLKVQDDTGVIDVNHWLNEDQDQAQLKSDTSVGSYVRVFGNVRSFDKKKSMQAYSIKPVTDFNEVVYHNLQVIFQHLHLTKGAAPAGGQHAAAGAGFGAARPAATQAFGAGAHAAAAPAAATGNSLHEDVMAVFNSPQYAAQDNGVHNDAVVEVLKQRGAPYGRQQIIDAIEFLVNEAHLYSTVDEEHHKSAQV